MKVIVRCLGCSKVTRFYGSYKVKILEDCNIILKRLSPTLLPETILTSC